MGTNGICLYMQNVIRISILTYKEERRRMKKKNIYLIYFNKYSKQIKNSMLKVAIIFFRTITAIIILAMSIYNVCVSMHACKDCKNK